VQFAHYHAVAYWPDSESVVIKTGLEGIQIVLELTLGAATMLARAQEPDHS